MPVELTENSPDLSGRELRGIRLYLGNNNVYIEERHLRSLSDAGRIHGDGINVTTDVEIQAQIARAVLTKTNTLVISGHVILENGGNGIYLNNLTEPFFVYFDNAFVEQIGTVNTDYVNFIRGRNCHSVFVDGTAVFDFRYAPFIQGLVTASAGSGPYTMDFDLDSEFTGFAFTTATQIYAFNTSDLTPKRLQFSNSGTPAALTLNSGVSWRATMQTAPTGFTNGDTVVVIHDKFEAHALYFSTCKNVYVGRGITIQCASGMGMYAANCDTIETHFRTRCQPDSNRLLSVTADGAHILGARETILIRDSVFDSHGDDGCIIMNLVLNVTSVTSSTIFVATVQNSDGTDVRAGDTLTVRTGPGAYVGTCTVQSVSANSTTLTITTTGAHGVVDGTYFVENTSAVPKRADFANNTIINCCGRGVVCQVPNARIMNNSIIHAMSEGIALSPYLDSTFGTGVIATDVVISHNELFECANNPNATCNVIQVAAEAYDGTYPTNQAFDNVIITCNTIKGSNHGAFAVGNCVKPIITFNNISDTNRTPRASPSNNFTNNVVSLYSNSNPTFAYNTYQGTEPATDFATRDAAGTSSANTGVETFYGNVGFTNTIPGVFSYAGTPESNVTARIGSLCIDRTNGKLYVKETGTGNTGWVLK